MRKDIIAKYKDRKKFTEKMIFNIFIKIHSEIFPYNLNYLQLNFWGFIALTKCPKNGGGIVVKEG